MTEPKFEKRECPMEIIKVWANIEIHVDNIYTKQGQKRSSKI